MSENTDSKNGQIQIADEVIAIIAGTAAIEVEGIVLSGNVASESFGGLFGKKNLAKGVKVRVEENESEIDIEVAVKFGTMVRLAAEEVQLKVKNAVETMTGLTVSVVNVTVSAVIVEKVKAVEETEEQ